MLEKLLATDIQVGDRFLVGTQIAVVYSVEPLRGTDSIAVFYNYPAKPELGGKQIVLAKYESLNKIS